MTRIACAIAGDLGDPIRRVTLGNPRAARAIMPVPETPVHKYGAPGADIGNVGITQNVLAVQAVAGRDGVQDFAHGKFGGGIARGDGAHDGGAVSHFRFIAAGADFLTVSVPRRIVVTLTKS